MIKNEKHQHIEQLKNDWAEDLFLSLVTVALSEDPVIFSTRMSVFKAMADAVNLQQQICTSPSLRMLFAKELAFAICNFKLVNNTVLEVYLSLMISQEFRDKDLATELYNLVEQKMHEVITAMLDFIPAEVLLKIVDTSYNEFSPDVAIKNGYQEIESGRDANATFVKNLPISASV
jgi:hypothetical protein